MVSETQKKRMIEYYNSHKEEISMKRKEYFKKYNAQRPKVENTEEIRQARNDYQRDYRARIRARLRELQPLCKPNTL